MAYPPLIGNSQGVYKIHIVGNSGAGKTTLAAELSSILRVPYYPLDTLFWNPGWKTTPTDEFLSKIEAILQDNEAKGWIIDGNYDAKGASIVDEYATDIIWLNPPLVLYFPRLIWRTFLRLIGLHPPCSPGCQESIRECLFSSDSIIWFCLSSHWKNIKRNEERMGNYGLGVGVKEHKMRRIGGWGAELKAWLIAVRDTVKGR
ncbi:hypothetical protein K435DRAFT_781528 [Dendrothele bispora CBS 962.96]|uniref:Adenylate kinase n=1 Tax=Dendrothele bispora (strain CBS 962.96) TaxID=1314807 RepID=A0A4S8LKG8_DENBC|nr:hypothetical protein K435DRAFT_781528 [Dendrothele bispora CBS 962.96]